MSRKNNHTDKAFKESLGNYQAVPPDNVWEGVSESLNADRRKVRIAWMGRIAAAAIILIAAGSTWLWVQRNEQSQIGRVEAVDNQEIPAERRTDNSMNQGDEIPGALDQSQSLDDKSNANQQSGQEATFLADGESIPPESSGSEAYEFRGQENQSFRPDDLPGLGSPASVDARSAPGGEMRIEGISRFNIPVNDPGTGNLQAMHMTRSQTAFIPGLQIQEEPQQGEGIDVFEEFGEDKINDYSKWAIGGQVTPLYSYRNVESSSESAAYTYSSTESYNDFESGILSYAGGVNVNYSPARRLSLQSGLYYSRQGMSITNSYVTSYGGQSLALSLPSNQLELNNSTGDIAAGDQKSNSIVSNLFGKFARAEWDANAVSPQVLGPEESPVVTEGDVLQQFEYLEIPLIARYRIVDRRLGFNVLGGLSTNFLVGNDVYFLEGNSKENIGMTREVKPINYSSVIGVGLQYSINRNFHINMEPTFRYYLNSVNTGSGLRSHPYSLGFFTGLSYSF